jgi:hypothetical protein
MEGEFAPPYFIQRDAGKHLCVPAPGAGLAELCPRVLTTADLSGGRFVAGKEVCVRGETWLAVHAEDGDTHLQLVTDEPLPYPTADSPYWLFGSTTENAPPYKDPSRPQGALVDPEIGDVVVAVGTMRFDDSHGWWEMHPAKAYFPVAKGRGLADAQRRYRTHPGALDELDYEELEKTWGKDERERAREIERERAARP